MSGSRHSIPVVLLSSLVFFCGPEARSADNLEAGVVSGVNGSWRLVGLRNTYSTPVEVCTVNYANNTSPVIVRVRNAAAGSFEVKLQNPSGQAVGAEAVHYVVVEEGTWRLPDGRLLEARRVLSSGTNYNGNWNLASMEAFPYQHEYTAPVVLGQVMTANDARWSVFWSRADSDRQDAPTAASCYVGKHVGEDAVTTRSAETLGVIVIEEGSGDIGGDRYETALGPQIVQAIGNSPPYVYALAFPSRPSVAVATLAGMNGGNGAWAYLFGADPLAPAALDLAVDEDQIGDAERNHSSPERVAYLVFATTVSAELTPVMTWPYATGFEADEFAPGSLDNQKGWTTTHQADVQSAQVYSGTQAVALTSMSAALRTFDPPEASAVVWIETFSIAEPVDGYPYPGYLREATCGVIHHTTGGISCLDGDRAGSGVWRSTGIHAFNAQPSEWTKISLRQDYAAHAYDLFVNGNRLLAGLCFLHVRDRIGGIEIQSGGEGPTFLDEVRVGADVATVPLFELKPAAVDFGEMREYQSTSVTLTITNLGRGAQRFDGVIQGVDAGLFEVVSGLPIAALGAGATESVVLRFAPTDARDYSAVLDVSVCESVLNTVFRVMLVGKAVRSFTAVETWQLY